MLSLRSRIVKKNILNEASTSVKDLLKINLKDNSTDLLPIKEVDIGFGARASLNKLHIPELTKYEFFRSCQKFLVSVSQKILKRCPLKCKMIRATSSISPSVLLATPVIAKQRFSIALDIFF